MRQSNNINKSIVASSALLLAILYIIMGLLEVFAGLGGPLPILIPAIPFEGLDLTLVFSGFTLLVIGGIFAKGFVNFQRPESETESVGISYVFVGLLVATAFGLLFLLEMGAHWVEFALLASEDFADWIWIADFKPAIWLFLISVPITLYLGLKLRG